jgi:hypothetical protein
MNSDQFCTNCTTSLIQRIKDLAHAFTRVPDERKDLIYTAWLAIDKELGDSTEKHYFDVAYKAMLKRYKLYYMPEPKKGRYLRHDAGVQRTIRKLKFFKRKLKR